MSRPCEIFLAADALRGTRAFSVLAIICASACCLAIWRAHAMEPQKDVVFPPHILAGGSGW